MLRRDKTIGLSVDEQRGARHIGDDPAVWESLGEGPREDAPDNTLHRCLDGGEGGDQDQASHWVLRCQEDRWPAPQRSSEEDDLGISDADLVHEEPEGGERDFVHRVFRWLHVVE
eukprot:CAMPEP_0181453436 /NCGR_PEP_ID=MMETSP1110-20121109/29724_1 /TAXON_ID=174948 /ORGANISM="Symbiodinium sp., Strain CCMP421" /LENGTH=114 /DNA_ID=CAMNT_0023577755 /DNA_START=396 /DNA_END=740 /DNA_ORIENTATION=-